MAEPEIDVFDALVDAAAASRGVSRDEVFVVLAFRKNERQIGVSMGGAAIGGQISMAAAEALMHGIEVCSVGKHRREQEAGNDDA